MTRTLFLSSLLAAATAASAVGCGGGHATGRVTGVDALDCTVDPDLIETCSTTVHVDVSGGDGAVDVVLHDVPEPGEELTESGAWISDGSNAIRIHSTWQNGQCVTEGPTQSDVTLTFHDAGGDVVVDARVGVDVTCMSLGE